MKYIPGNIFHNSFYSSLFDVPISIAGGFIYHHLGPRATLTIAFSVALLGSISILIWSEDHPGLVPVMLTLVKSGVKVAFDVCYLANSTIFPAIFAGTAFGLCNMGAKVATIMSPLIAEVEAPVPMLCFSVASGLALILAQGIKVNKSK